MSTPFPLGRHPQAAEHHDPRSLNYPVAVADQVPNEIYWRRYGVSLDQQQVGACTCFAADGALNHAPNHTIGGHLWTNAESFALYDWVTHNDPYDGAWTWSGTGDLGTGEDTGSDGLSAAKGEVQFGRATGYTHAFGLDHLVQGLPNGPFIVGTDWYEGMFTPTGFGLVSISGSIAGGHEYVVDGACVSCRLLRCNNSWSNAWGVRGRFYLSWDTADTLLGAGGDAIQLQVA